MPDALGSYVTHTYLRVTRGAARGGGVVPSILAITQQEVLPLRKLLARAIFAPHFVLILGFIESELWRIRFEVRNVLFMVSSNRARVSTSVQSCATKSNSLCVCVCVYFVVV